MAELLDSRMNFSAVKRVDPYVKDLVETAAHVALYTFNAEDNEWEKTDVEGALHVYSRTGEPFHNIIIINRLNTNNFVEPITQGLDLHLQDPFLLYRTGRGSIFCIWFYNKEECSRIANALEKLVKETVVQEKKNQAKKRNDNNPGVDIFSMLSKAQEEYNSKSPRRNQLEGDDAKGKENDSTPRSVMEFFAKASSGTQFNKDAQKGNSGPIMIGPRPLPPPGLAGPVQIGLPHPHQQGDVKPILQRLMSNPAHSVEHIEKQQRSVTPQSELAALMRSKAPNLASGKDSNALPNSKHNSLKNSRNVSKDNQKIKPLNVQSQLENGMGFLRISDSSPTVGQNSQNFFTKIHSPTTEVPLDQRPLSAPHSSNLDIPTNSLKPALMPPVMFTSSALKEEPVSPSIRNINLPSSSSTTGQPVSLKPEPMTKNQLLQAFNYLLKNDPDFMRKLHEAYLKSFSDLVS